MILITLYIVEIKIIDTLYTTGRFCYFHVSMVRIDTEWKTPSNWSTMPYLWKGHATTFYFIIGTCTVPWKNM